jgi:hypothetical protein
MKVFYEYKKTTFLLSPPIASSQNMQNKDWVIGRDVSAKRPSSGVYCYEGMQYKRMKHIDAG